MEEEEEGKEEGEKEEKKEEEEEGEEEEECGSIHTCTCTFNNDMKRFHYSELQYFVDIF